MLRAGRGFGKLAWKGVKSEVWAFAMLMLHLLVFFVFSNVGLRCPSFEGFWEGQKVRGLGLGWLPPSVGMGGCCMLHLEGLVGGVVVL